MNREMKGLSEEVRGQARRISYLEGLIKMVFSQPITEMGLSIRVVNLLSRALGCRVPTVAEVALLSGHELEGIRGLGYKGTKEIKGMLRPGKITHVPIGKATLAEGYQPTVSGVVESLHTNSSDEDEARILAYFVQHPDEVYRPPEIIEQLTNKISWTRGPSALYPLIRDLASSGVLGRLGVPPYVFYGSHQAIEDLQNRIIGRCKEVRHVEKV